MADDKVTFSFGKNWESFLSAADASALEKATADIEEWLGQGSVKGKTVLDIGSGSGLHSLAYFHLGATSIVSFDYDQHSVAATKECWRRAGSPDNWQVMHGSVLDRAFIQSLGTFDIVYSWGVLHHTGSMWKAIEHATLPIKPGGLFWISIYNKTPNYPKELALKQQYNRSNWFGKKWLELREIGKTMRYRYQNHLNPFTWNERRMRGMDAYHDIVDWLGGLPYEVATGDELITFCAEWKLTPVKTIIGQHATNILLFSRASA